MSDEDLPQGRHRSLLLDQLTDERATKNSIEQRGMAVIANAGALVTITLGFAALASTDEATTLRPAVVVLLTVALAMLVAASAAGLVINLPARLPMVDADDLASLALREDWDVADRESSRTEYQILARLLAELRAVNHRRARTLLAALLSEVAALFLMAIGVVLVLGPLV
ncbi:hypothetical protein [Streptomyces caeruleatus]|uniref:Integral membrane plasmid transfer protein n=1 Tax=Streptomyces caeruleatus TaxID=661399 RepID=A0A101U5U3_9ACTN|nr:hypothetical protein [Streptomyces caeruleatus]KUO04643.1 hypothetical protein AQJ67_10630 [Streptomyces caeruleatus]